MPTRISNVDFYFDCTENNRRRPLHTCLMTSKPTMKSKGNGPQVPRQTKWLRCLQCDRKFAEPDFKAHQRERKSPCELVRMPETSCGPRLYNCPRSFPRRARLSDPTTPLRHTRLCLFSHLRHSVPSYFSTPTASAVSVSPYTVIPLNTGQMWSLQPAFIARSKGIARKGLQSAPW